MRERLAPEEVAQFPRLQRRGQRFIRTVFDVGAVDEAEIGVIDPGRIGARLREGRIDVNGPPGAIAGLREADHFVPVGLVGGEGGERGAVQREQPVEPAAKFLVARDLRSGNLPLLKQMQADQPDDRKGYDGREQHQHACPYGFSWRLHLCAVIVTDR